MYEKSSLSTFSGIFLNPDLHLWWHEAQPKQTFNYQYYERWSSHAFIIYSHSKMPWNLEKKIIKDVHLKHAWNHLVAKCNTNQTCRPKGPRKFDRNICQMRVMKEPSVTNEKVPRTLNNLHGNKILIVNPTNQQQLTHAATAGEKVRELGL